MDAGFFNPQYRQGTNLTTFVWVMEQLSIIPNDKALINDPTVKLVGGVYENASRHNVGRYNFRDRLQGVFDV